jgi:hypothetical protein
MTDHLLNKEALGSEFRHPIQVNYCRACHVSQTNYDVHHASYYKDYRYTSGHSPFMQHFMESLADEVWRRWHLKSGDTVVEIGSGDGAQLGFFKRLGARVLGYEPSEPLCQISRDHGVPVITGLFDSEAVAKIPPEFCKSKAVLLTYTFDHLPEPMRFLADVEQIMDRERGVLLIEVHDLEKIMERNEYCLFEHEHTVYLSAATIAHVLSRAGFTVLELGLLPEKQRRGNSLIVVAAPSGSAWVAESDVRPALSLGRYSERVFYHEFGKSLEDRLAWMRRRIGEKKAQGLMIAGYGAGGRGVMTMAAVAEPGDIDFVCDGNLDFHGRYTPVSHVLVCDPSELERRMPDEVVVFSFGYFEEIKAKAAGYLARGGRMVNLLDILAGRWP